MVSVTGLFSHRSIGHCQMGRDVQGACARCELEFEYLWTSRVHGVCAGFSWFLMTGVDRVRAPPVTGVYIQILGQSWTAMKWDTNIFLYLSLSLSLYPSLTLSRLKSNKKRLLSVIGLSLFCFLFLSRIFFFYWENWQKYLHSSRFTKWHNLKK